MSNLNNVIDWDIVLKIIPAMASCVTAVVAFLTYQFAKDSFNKWHTEQVGKRKVELAEQAMSIFSKMPEILKHIRFPFVVDENEGKSQQTASLEWVNQGHISLERRERYQDFFHNLLELKYLFLAYFGQEHCYIFDDAFDVFNIVNLSARMIKSNEFEENNELKIQCLKNLCTNSKNDPLQNKIEGARDRMIAICQPILQPQSTKKP